MPLRPMRQVHATISEIISELDRHYGPPPPPVTTDPFELILWELVGYLVDDARRLSAYKLLKKRVGLSPARILAADEKTLLVVTKAGGSIGAAVRAERLRRAAMLVLAEWGGDLSEILKLPVNRAKKALTRFPAIGEPGAEKILLLSRSHPVLALDSNGLRVLVRIGFAVEQKSYSATYRAVKSALETELESGFDWLIRAHLLLRRHGQELCKRSSPICSACPLRQGCAYFRSQGKVPPQSRS